MNSRSLSRAEYYSRGFITRGTDTFNKWKNRRDVRILLNAHAREDSLKTMIMRRLRKRIRRFYRKSHDLWRLMAKPYKWASLKFHIKNEKQSVLQRAVNSLLLEEHRRTGTRPIIFLGDGGMSHGYWFPGTRAVPQFFKDLLLRNGFEVRMVN